MKQMTCGMIMLQWEKTHQSDGMMAKISQVCNLSKRYTNHCIRSTCITALYDNGIETRHIMGLSGHKSESA